MLSAALRDRVGRRDRRAVALEHDAGQIVPHDVRRVVGVALGGVEAGHRAEVRDVLHVAPARVQRADEVLRVDAEVEEVARAAVGPHVEPLQRVVRQLARRDLRRVDHVADDAVRIAVPERLQAGRDGELLVALADVVAVARLRPAAGRLLLRAGHAVEAVVVEALAVLEAVIALGAGRVVLRVVVVAVRVVVDARRVARLHARRDAVDAVVVPLLVAGPDDGLELVADAVAVVVDGERHLERVAGEARLPLVRPGARVGDLRRVVAHGDDGEGAVGVVLVVEVVEQRRVVRAALRGARVGDLLLHRLVRVAVDRIDPHLALAVRVLAEDALAVRVDARGQVLPVGREVPAVRVAEHDREVAEDLDVVLPRERAAVAALAARRRELVPPEVERLRVLVRLGRLGQERALAHRRRVRAVAEARLVGLTVGVVRARRGGELDLRERGARRDRAEAREVVLGDVVELPRPIDGPAERRHDVEQIVVA